MEEKFTLFRTFPSVFPLSFLLATGHQTSPRGPVHPPTHPHTLCFSLSVSLPLSGLARSVLVPYTNTPRLASAKEVIES